MASEQFFTKVAGALGLGIPTNPVEVEKSFLDPIKRNAFFMARLPALAFFGVGVSKLTARECTVDLPFTWRTQNPFQSVYFAAQLAAGELSTGALILRAVAGKQKVSMLVVDMQAEFTKKAKGDVQFTCVDGEVIHQAAEQAAKGEEVEVWATSVGRLVGGKNDGTEVSRMKVRWAIKGVSN